MIVWRCERRCRLPQGGFYQVLPHALVSVFDFQELELLLCGMPELNLGDWQRHTEYTKLPKGALSATCEHSNDGCKSGSPCSPSRIASGLPLAQGFAVL